ncbi:MAG TPA: hypothetical protein ENI90_02110 [Methylothermaceae bacterium]|nr:hypothetical protein [Methylothermaceae bacterium]
MVSADRPYPNLTTKQLARIYLRKQLLGPGGVPWRPLNLPASHPLRRVFSSRVLGRSPEELESYWNIQYFNGVLPPYVVDSEAAVEAYVAATPGAIGYLRRCQLHSDRVRIIATLKVKLPTTLACR